MHVHEYMTVRSSHSGSDVPTHPGRDNGRFLPSLTQPCCLPYSSVIVKTVVVGPQGCLLVEMIRVFMSFRSLALVLLPATLGGLPVGGAMAGLLWNVP
jgi:hypothetical protein